uniref:U11/U12 small nuclear ribonucleoprotein 35 kDa protein n=1 Tax=Eptatretus burgeri TaxID=7764 RepID=A0A8C4NFC2_EPTBU
MNMSRVTWISWEESVLPSTSGISVSPLVLSSCYYLVLIVLFSSLRMEEDIESWSPIARTYNPLRAGSIDGTDDKPHDRGIARAIHARYKPNKGVQGDPSRTLFIGRLSPNTTEDSLRAAFSVWGSIRSIRLVRDVVTGASKCYAFVEFCDREIAKRVCHHGNHMNIDDVKVFIDWELGRTLAGWVPRRLGGGLGGKKESGQLRFGGRDRPFRKPILMTTRGREGRFGWERFGGERRRRNFARAFASDGKPIRDKGRVSGERGRRTEEGEQANEVRSRDTREKEWPCRNRHNNTEDVREWKRNKDWERVRDRD